MTYGAPASLSAVREHPARKMPARENSFDPPGMWRHPVATEGVSKVDDT
jgi:hypothetical protein